MHRSRLAQVDRHRRPRKKLTDAAAWWALGCPGSDVEEHIPELIEQGWCEEAIAEERRVAAELVEPGEIWTENWTTIQVFCRCAWTRIVGPTQLVWDGIPAQEIHAVLIVMQVPRTEWRTVFDGVRAMVDAALPHLNADRRTPQSKQDG